MRHLLIACLIISSTGAYGADLPAGNLLKNGSFEDSHKYWYWGIDQKNTRIVDGGVYGSHALRIDKDFCWSGSFRIPPGARVTLSASVRAEADKAHVHFFLVPHARGAGVEPFRVFWEIGSRTRGRLQGMEADLLGH